MPRLNNWPQYPSTRGWALSASDCSGDETVLATSNQLCATLTEINPRRPSSSIKHEAKNSRQPTSKKRSNRHDWPHRFATARERAENSNIVELPVSEVGRVLEGGRVTGLYNLDKKGSKHFIAYDGDHVYACVPHLYQMDIIILDLASLHIANGDHFASPEDIEVEKNWQKMTGSLAGTGWAIHIHPKANFPVKEDHA
ncbi:CAZyme family CE10 [Apiospora arundinis]